PRQSSGADSRSRKSHSCAERTSDSGLRKSAPADRAFFGQHPPRREGSLGNLERLLELLASPSEPPAKQSDGVFLKYQWSDIFAEGDLLKVCEPPFRSNEWKIRSEEHLVLEQCMCVLNQRWREVLGRPSRKVDKNLRFVQTDRERFVLPWK